MDLTILRKYAKCNPKSFPASVLLTHTKTSLTVFDAYPKSTFHFLILPRLKASTRLSESDLTSLKTLLKSDKEQAKDVLLSLKKDSEEVTEMIKEEMQKRFGFKWRIWVGFHAVPSLEHLHLHIVSSDLCSPSLKTKKHYNSFHSTLGFFLHLDDVLEWFDTDPAYFSTVSKLEKSEYELLVKTDLSCWRCGQHFKNIPTLKEHLQEEWDRESAKERAKIQKKRLREVQNDTETTSKVPKFDSPVGETKEESNPS